MPAASIRSAATCLAACLVALPADAGQSTNGGVPVTASVSRPVSSIRDLPAMSVMAAEVQRDGRPLRYIARVYASVDGTAFAPVGDVQPGKGQGGRIDMMLPDVAAAPGFHALRVKVEFSDESGIQPYALPPVFYAIFDPTAESSAFARTLVYGPASTPGKDLDPQLGDEPFAAWLSGVASARRAAGNTGPEWWSDYCDNRTGDPTRKTPPTAVCSVVAFETRGELTEIWFRTADIREMEQRVEWVPVTPAHFEGMTLNHVPEIRGLSSLPSLLDIAPELRAAGDLSILPDDIVTAPARLKPGAPADVTITVRNIGHQDLHKAQVTVAWGVDTAARPSTRQFVVDVPAQGTAELKLQVVFPNGYGFIMAHAMPIGEHSPSGTWTPDPTPDDDCAFRVITAELAPPRFKEKLLEDAGPGCTAK